MQCLIKSQYKEELKQYADILGSEDAAYYVLAMNNGFTLDQTHEGAPSELYSALVSKNGGDIKKAILEKCIIFTPEFMKSHGDFTRGTYNGTLDSNKEPSIVDLNDGNPLCDTSLMTDVLSEAGNKLQIFKYLENHNILVRRFAIQDLLDLNRSVWVQSGIDKFLEKHPDANPLTTVRKKLDLEEQWDQEKMDKILNSTQKKIAEYFDLELVTDEDGNFYYKTKEDSPKSKVQVMFVNSLRKGSWRDSDGNIHKGLFVDNTGTSAAINLIYVSMNDGDITTIIHELAHHYIRTFWETEPVQYALKQFDKMGLVRKYKKNPTVLEEKLARHITNEVLQYDKKSWVYKFWQKFNKMITKNLGFDVFGYNKRENILDAITSYFSIAEDLSQNKASKLLYSKYDRILHEDLYSESEIKNNLYTHLLRMLTNKKNAIKSKILKDDRLLKDIKLKIEDLKRIDPSDEVVLKDTFIDFLTEATSAINKLSNELAIYGISDDLLYNADARHLLELKTDIIEYYAVMFGDISISYFKDLPGIKNDMDLINTIKELRSDIDSCSELYNKCLKKYINNKINQWVDLYVDIGDAETVKFNMKLWLENKINRGNVMLLENWMGIASQSASPIVTIVEYLTQSVNNRVFTQSAAVGEELSSIYKKAKPKSDWLTPKNFMRLFCELDENGQPTGYWIRRKNYGQMFRDKDKLMDQLLDEFKDSGVCVDEDGEYYFPDEATRLAFLDRKDDLEATICHKRYTPEYYKTKRRYLSQETIDVQERINSQIDLLVQKHININTGVPEIHKLTVEERRKLNELYRERDNLGSPYIILYNDDGSIREFSEKPVGSPERKIADEISQWKNALSDQIKYKPNVAKFEKHRQYLVDKYGEGSEAVKKYDFYYSSTQISPRFYDLKKQRFVSELPDNIKELYRRRSIIINSVKDKRGYYQPHLEKLNDQAWAELKRIDEQLNLYNYENRVEEDEEQDAISSREMVLRYANGKITNRPYFFYLKDVTPPSVFERKYMVIGYNKDGEEVLKPLSVFFYEAPFKELEDNAGKFKSVETLPTGMYMEIDPESYFADEKYDTSDPSYMQPNDKYINKQYDEIYGKDENGNYIHPERVEFYEAILKIMSEANSMIPNYIDTRSFRMPGMTERTSHLLFRQSPKKTLKHLWNKVFSVSDRDTEYNETEEIARKPNGDIVNTIPLRWIKLLDDPSQTTTDIISSVVSYYEMALNYNYKQQFAPLTELIYSEITGGINRTGFTNWINGGQQKRLRTYIDMYVYGKMRTGLSNDPSKKMSETEKRLGSTLDKLARNSYLKLMAHNFRGIIKNFIDAGMTTIVEAAAGKYFTQEDLTFAMGECSVNIIGGISSISAPNNTNKISAAMRYNRVSGRIIDMFERQNETRVRRLIEKHAAMGEYSFVDYTIKGWIMPAIYHNHRLVDNFGVREVFVGDLGISTQDNIFLTRNEAKQLGVIDRWESSTIYRREYMNEEQAISNYIKAGKTAKEGHDAWENSEGNLWDAYYINENGTFTIKPEYLDLVRPWSYTLKHRSRKTEDRVYGICRDRFAVIAGMLPEENRGPFMKSYLGTFIFMLRGFMVTFAWDMLRRSNMYATYAIYKGEVNNISKLPPNPGRNSMYYVRDLRKNYMWDEEKGEWREVHVKKYRRKNIFKKEFINGVVKGDPTSSQAIKIKDDVEFEGESFDFNAGHTGKGWWVGNHKAWGRLMANTLNKVFQFIFKTNKVLKRAKPVTKTGRQQIAKMSSYLLMFLITIIGTHLFGRLLEEDPDNLFYNFGYSESVALIPERSTQINPMTVMDLIKNTTAAQAYIDDINSMWSVPLDLYYTTGNLYNYITQDEEYIRDRDKVIKSGSYKGLTISERNLLKASSIVLPELGLNNIYKNLSIYGHRSYQNWQLQQQPSEWLTGSKIVYKPDLIKGRKFKDNRKEIEDIPRFKNAGI